MRELPRKLSVDELTALFSGRTLLVDVLAEIDDPLERAEDVALTLDDRDQEAALATHPRIGEPSPEQRGEDPTIITELAYLNQVYEEKFGFRFVVFVDQRSRAELLPVLRERLERTREEELETGVRELVAIARDRWQRS
jgi:OHCU decarboxylase